MTALVVMACSASAQVENGASEVVTPSPEQSVENLALLGKGVHKIKKSSEGGLQSCVVVGQARISESLGKSKGILTAQRNAKLDAESAFVAWLKTNVKSVEQSGDKTEVMLASGAEGPTETGSSTETSSALIQSSAEGAIRGLTLIGRSVDAEAGILTLVYGWKPEYASLTRDAEQSMTQESPEAGTTTTTTSVKVQSTIIKTEVTVSEEAGDFL